MFLPVPLVMSVAWNGRFGAMQVLFFADSWNCSSVNVERTEKPFSTPVMKGGLFASKFRRSLQVVKDAVS